ncbi:MAG TPA: type III pantothenate kinase [Synergistales bacterium]|nr:type III pantothenate kinase [Synergistaceae bacterium]HOO86187.1 type III pantothenate kinase [Synergistales bacterium]HPE66148.1 type III pantothenate kinase [Synergistales bacterium]
MLLVLDVGNTTTVIGIYEGDTLKKHWRLMSERHTSDELGIYLLNLLSISGISLKALEGAIYSSVVPSLDTALSEGLEEYLGVVPVKVTASLDLGMEIAYSPKHEVGADRLVNSVAGKARFGAPLIVVDFGTAITLDILNKEGAYLGGTISPGLVTGMEALFGRTAKLPQVSLEPPKSVIGNNTIGSIQAGILFGNAGLVDSLVRRTWSELGTKTPVAATGGHASVVASLSETITHVDPWLTLEGLRLIYERNRAR